MTLIVQPFDSVEGDKPWCVVNDAETGSDGEHLIVERFDTKDEARDYAKARRREIRHTTGETLPMYGNSVEELFITVNDKRYVVVVGSDGKPFIEVDDI